MRKTLLKSLVLVGLLGSKAGAGTLPTLVGLPEIAKSCEKFLLVIDNFTPNKYVVNVDAGRAQVINSSLIIEPKKGRAYALVRRGLFNNLSWSSVAYIKKYGSDEVVSSVKISVPNCVNYNARGLSSSIVNYNEKMLLANAYYIPSKWSGKVDTVFFKIS